MVLKLKALFPLFISFCMVFSAAAQTDCPSIVNAALDAVNNVCQQTDRNEVCYGNIVLKATPYEGVSDLVFTKAGDRANVTDIQTLQLSSMSLNDNSWGVALMKLQANLPDTLPGQNVIFLLFGDVQVENAVTDAPPVRLITTSNVNVRTQPSTNSSVMMSLKAGADVQATGRLADGQWVRIQVAGDARGVGWVSADFLRGSLDKLATVQRGEPNWGPMQSFYFTTGYGDRPCAEAPDSGILIQTPKGAGKVTLNANDVEIQLGSTVYLQAQPSNPMTVTVVEGQAVLQAGGQTQIVPAGTYSQVALDASGKASGVPSFPKPYDSNPLQTLPLGTDYFYPVKIATPLTTAQINAYIQAVLAPVTTSVPAASGGSSSPQSNTPSGVTHWKQDEVVNVATCPGPPHAGDTNTWYPTIVFSPDQTSFTYDGGPNNTTVTLTQTGANAYAGTFLGSEHFTFTFSSPNSYSFSWIGIHGDPNNGGCRFEMSATGTRTG